MAAIEHAQSEERAALEAKFNAQKHEQEAQICEAMDHEYVAQVKEDIKHRLERVSSNVMTDTNLVTQTRKSE